MSGAPQHPGSGVHAVLCAVRGKRLARFGLRAHNDIIKRRNFYQEVHEMEKETRELDEKFEEWFDVMREWFDVAE